MNNMTPEQMNARILELEAALKQGTPPLASSIQKTREIEILRSHVRELSAENHSLVTDRNNLRESLRELQAKGEAEWSATKRMNEALLADRKRLEAEVRRLTDQLSGKSSCHLSATEAQESARVCDRRELEMCAHGMEEKSMATYWQEKYHELKRLHSLQEKADINTGFEMITYRETVRQVACALGYKEGDELALPEIVARVEALMAESKVAADQVASLQAKLEGARARAEQEARECTANKRRLDMANGLLNEIRAALDGGVQETEYDIVARIQKMVKALKCDPKEMEPITYIDGTKHFSESPHFRWMMASIGAEILEINRGNGWDVTKPGDWPKQPDDDNASGTAKVRKLMTNLALIHSEVSEASEAIRKLDRQNFEEELADVIIRVLDTSHGLGIDLGPVICAKLKKNRGRGHKHGGKAI